MLKRIELIVTMVLVGVTWWYAKHTKRMADVMARDYETRLSPIIEVKKGSAQKGGYDVTTSMEIKNIGFIYGQGLEELQEKEVWSCSIDLLLQGSKIQLAEPEELFSVSLSNYSDHAAGSWFGMKIAVLTGQ